VAIFPKKIKPYLAIINQAWNKFKKFILLFSILATHWKPTIEIWKVFTSFPLTSGDWKPPKSLKFRILAKKGGASLLIAHLLLLVCPETPRPNFLALRPAAREWVAVLCAPVFCSLNRNLTPAATSRPGGLGPGHLGGGSGGGTNTGAAGQVADNRPPRTPGYQSSWNPGSTSCNRTSAY
jgi:hypothetical protein